VHSDGTLTPAALMQRFNALGFDFVAITDHNNTTHRREMKEYSAAHPRPLWIAGEEVTTPNGHANVWGLDDNEWVDFRVKAGEEPGIADLVSSARRFGALFSINHPASTCVGCGWEHAVPKEVTAIEISNGRHGEVDGALARWDSLLTSGHEITGVGSSDWHADPNPIDMAHVRVMAMSLGETAILNAIASGRVIVMNGASWKTPEITAEIGNQTATVGGILRLSGGTSIDVAIGADDLPGGRVTAVINGDKVGETTLDAQGRARWQQSVSPGYIRFELRAADGSLVAIANPIRLRR
jgi:hypothetical protein